MLPLEISQLRKTYKSKNNQEVEAVRKVSFSVNSGEIFGLLGPNGAGKTSIISIITTLEKKSGGEVLVFGHDVQKEALSVKRLIGVVPQEIVTQGFFNLVEILTFHSGYYGIWKNKERVEFLLNKLGLWEHRHKLVKQLSGGMKRRLMIAKALVHKPKLLLLDEPTAGVDIEMRTSLWKFVRELKEEGISILLTTHYLQEAEELCDRVGIINSGELVKAGETKTIVQTMTKKTVELEFGLKPPEAVKKLIQSNEYYVSGTDLKSVFSVPHELDLGPLLKTLNMDLSLLKDVRIREGNLEEAFISLLKGAPNVSSVSHALSP